MFVRTCVCVCVCVCVRVSNALVRKSHIMLSNEVRQAEGR